MEVKKLKTSLAARNLSRNGLKEVLVVRVKKAVANGMGSVENDDSNIL